MAPFQRRFCSLSHIYEGPSYIPPAELFSTAAGLIHPVAYSHPPGITDPSGDVGATGGSGSLRIATGSGAGAGGLCSTSGNSFRSIESLESVESVQPIKIENPQIVAKTGIEFFMSDSLSPVAPPRRCVIKVLKHLFVGKNLCCRCDYRAQPIGHRRQWAIPRLFQ